MAKLIASGSYSITDVSDGVGLIDSLNLYKASDRISGITRPADVFNLIRNGAYPTTGWVGSTVKTHEMYYGGQKSLFCISTNGSAESLSRSNIFKVKRNTVYSLSFKAFSSSNVKSSEVLFLGRKDGETSDFTSVDYIIPARRFSVSEVEYVTATFNSGDNDNGYIRFDNNGSSDGQMNHMFFGEVTVVQGPTPVPWVPSAEDEGWSLTAPVLTQTSRNLWNYRIEIYSDGSTRPTDPVIIGVRGVDGKTPYVHWAYSDNADGTGLAFSDNGQRYIGHYSDYTQDDSTDKTKYTWTDRWAKIEVGGRNLAQKTSSDWSTPYTWFKGTTNTIVNLHKVLIDDLKVGDTLKSRIVLKYTDIIPASGRTATIWLQGNGNITSWNAGSYNGSPDKPISGSGEMVFEHEFKITANHLKNEYWNWQFRTDYIASGSLQWKLAKVEKGTLFTGWSPAWEDAQFQLLTLTADSQVLALDKEGEPKTPNITLTATAQNITGTISFTVTGIKADNTETAINATPSNNQITLSGSLAKTYVRIKVTASLGTLSDTVTLTTVKDASPTISAQLSNENVTLPATNAGVVTAGSYASASGNFKVYEGSTDVTSLCTFSLTQVSGVTANITATGAYSVTSISDTLDSVALVFTATYKGQQYSRTFNIGKSKMGATGADAKLLSLSSTRDYFAYDKEGVANPTNQIISIKANLYNLTGTVSYSVGGFNTAGTRTALSLTPTGNNLNIPVATMASYVYLEVTASLTSGGVTYTDTKTISRVQDGSQAVVGWLTNESITVPASTTGEVDSASLSAINGAFKVFYGSTDVTSQSVFSYTRDDPKYTFAINSSGVYTIGSLASGPDSFQIPVRATYNGKTVDKVVSISKSKTGATGTSAYMWIMYAINSSGGSAVDVPPANNADAYKYIGIAVTSSPVKPAANSGSYTWTLYTGKDGVGRDGKSVHIKYSDDGGATFTANNGETPGKWIGLYVDTVYEDSSNPADYTWNLAVQEALSPNPNLLPAGIADAYQGGSYTYDPITNIYTITSIPRADGWFTGISVNNTVVPYGEAYRISGSFYCEAEVDIMVDINNYRAGSSSNDNDDHTGSRRSSSSPTQNTFLSIMRLPAGKWTTLWWGSKNANSDNTDKLDIKVYDTFGIRGNMITTNTTFKVRDLKLELGDKVTPYTSSKADLKGEDAIVATLTNDSYGAPASSSGTVTAGGLTGANTTMKLYKGTSEITNLTGWTFTADAVSGTGTYNLTANNLNITGISTDTLTIRLTANHSTYGSFIRDFSVTKVKQGSVLGENKWIGRKYSYPGSTRIYPSFDHIQGLNPVETHIFDDSTKFTFWDDYYIAHFQSNLYVNIDKQITTNVVHDDDLTIYCNDEVVVSKNTTILSPPYDITFNLKAGWNKIDILLREIAGGDHVTFGTKLSSLVDHLSYIKGADGVYYALDLSTLVVSKSPANTFSPAALTAKLKKVSGASSSYVSAKFQFLEYDINSTQLRDSGKLTATSSQNYAITNVNCKYLIVRAYDPAADTTEWDYQTVYVVKDGIDSYSMDIKSDKGFIFSFDKDNLSVGVTSITLSPNFSGPFTPSTYAWTKNGSAAGTSGVLTIPANDLKTTTNILVGLTVTGSVNGVATTLTATTNVTKVKDGAENYLVQLSRETAQFPTDENGGLLGTLTNNTTTVSVFKGATAVTPNITGLTTSGCTATSSGATVTITGISADSGYVDIAVNADGKALGTTRFSFLKVRQGQSTKLYLAWADSADGTIGFSTTTASGKKYMGAYTTTSSTQSTDPSVYKWTETSNAFTLGGRNYLLNSDFLDGASYWSWNGPSDKTVGIVDDTDGTRVMQIDLSNSTATGSALYSNGWNAAYMTAVKGDSVVMSGYLKVLSGEALNNFFVAEELNVNGERIEGPIFKHSDTRVEWPNGKPTVFNTNQFAFNTSQLAVEGQSFTLSERSNVRYGNYDKWFYRTLEAGTYSVSNATFGGDPYPTVAKVAELVAVGVEWPNGKPTVLNTSQLAVEGQSFTLSERSNVRYGNYDKWLYRTFEAGTYSVSNATFGGDPYPTVTKVAELVVVGVEWPNGKPTVFNTSQLAAEGQSFTLSERSNVRYGNYDKWFYRTLEAGTYSVSNATFGGDPYPTVAKVAELVVVGEWKKFIIRYTLTNASSNRIRFAARNDSKSKVYFKFLKAEGGTVATEWSANPDDYYRRLDTVRTTANAANTSLTEMASDTKLTGLEKLQVNKEVETIKDEYPLLTAQADIYSITAEKTAYTSKYNTLISYITPLLSSLTTTSDIVAATFRNTFKDYYTAKTNLINAIYTTLNNRTTNTAQTTLVQLTNVVQDITGWSATVSEQYIKQATGGTNQQVLSSLQSTIKTTARSIDLTVQDNGQLTPTGQSINSKYATINLTSDAIEFKVGGTTKASVKMTSGSVVFDFTNSSGAKKITTVGSFTAWSWNKEGTDRFTTVYPNLNLLEGTSGPFVMTYGIPNTTWDTTKQVSGISLPVTVMQTEVLPQGNGFWYTYTPGVTYTQSIYISTDAPLTGTPIKFTWFTSEYGHNGNGVDTLVKVSTNLYRATSTYTWPSSNSPAVGRNADLFNLTQVFNFTKGTFLQFYKPKLELGSVATPWMPSSSEVKTTDWPSYIGYSVVYSDNPADYSWTSNPDWSAEVLGEGLAAAFPRDEFNDYKTKTLEPELGSKVNADDEYQKVKNAAIAGKDGVDAITGNNGTLNKTVKDAKDELTKNLNAYKEEVKDFKFTPNITKIDGNGISVQAVVGGEAKPRFAIDISSTKLSFKENDIEAAFITGKTFQITNGTITTVFQVGSHQFRKHDSNHTVIQWIKP